jgi:2',3'-cyclic-nucleotide 2'-phosphodiesterase (5'-nucleotidase family)
VAFHIPAHSNVWKTEDWDGEPAIRDDWVPAFVAGGVDLVLAGHAHAYQRGELDGVTYVVTGGAGGTLDTKAYDHWEHLGVVFAQHHYGLLDVADGELRWAAIGLDGSELDGFTLTAR